MTEARQTHHEHERIVCQVQRRATIFLHLILRHGEHNQFNQSALKSVSQTQNDHSKGSIPRSATYLQEHIHGTQQAERQATFNGTNEGNLAQCPISVSRLNQTIKALASQSYLVLYS
jgi:hypothetical protein